MALPQKILIVGGGVFGLSTALELSKRHPNSQVTLLEASPTIPNPHGSSVDTSRIVRADYAHPVYAKLGADAIQRWRNTDWGKDGRYTQNGLLLVYPRDNTAASAYARRSYENVRSLGDKADFLPTKEAVLKIASAYDAGMQVAGGYVNWGSGWADAEAGVRFVKRKLDEEGKVHFRTGEAARLLFADVPEMGGDGVGGSNKRRVTGVVLADGTSILADLVILATGAWTPKLVNLRGRAIATGQVLAYIRISDEEQRRLAHVPTILSFASGIFIIPPRNNLLKIARHAYGYTNPTSVTMTTSGNGHGHQEETVQISLPAADSSQIPREGEEAFRSALKELLPNMADRPFSHTRICWYTDTPKGDFIVTYHPDHPGLFLATGGSGHAYKFFPILGEKVVDALEGRLESDLRELWRWPDAQEAFDGTEDGSRSGQKGLVLSEELAKMTTAAAATKAHTRRGSRL